MADEVQTVRSDETGELHEVVQVKAVAALASVNAVGYEWPAEASKHIQNAMSVAAANAIAEFGHDDDKIREAMLKARESVKIAMRNHMLEWAKQQAAQQEK